MDPILNHFNFNRGFQCKNGLIDSICGWFGVSRWPWNLQSNSVDHILITLCRLWLKWDPPWLKKPPYQFNSSCLSPESCSACTLAVLTCSSPSRAASPNEAPGPNTPMGPISCETLGNGGKTHLENPGNQGSFMDLFAQILQETHMVMLENCHRLPSLNHFWAIIRSV